MRFKQKQTRRFVHSRVSRCAPTHAACMSALCAPGDTEFERFAKAGTILQLACDRDAKVAIRAFLQLYEFQTAEEQALGVTFARNGVGFNQHDAARATYIANRLREGKPLKYAHFEQISSLLTTYRQQLLRHVDEDGLRTIFEGTSSDEDEGADIDDADDDDASFDVDADSEESSEEEDAEEGEDEEDDDEEDDDEEDDDDQFVATPSPPARDVDSDGDVGLPMEVPAVRADHTEDLELPVTTRAYANFTVTSCGIRGGVILSDALKVLFARIEREEHDRLGRFPEAHELFLKLQCVPELSIGDVHAHLWSERSGRFESEPVGKRLCFYDGNAWVTGAVNNVVHSQEGNAYMVQPDDATSPIFVTRGAMYFTRSM